VGCNPGAKAVVKTRNSGWIEEVFHTSYHVFVFAAAVAMLAFIGFPPQLDVNIS
jgi:hypothetical protein